MMMIPSYFFKARAWKALKGNWQTALLVSFFASIFTTALQVLVNLYMPVATTYAELELALLRVKPAQVTVIFLTGVLALLVTPVLALGSNAYFLARLRGRELGFKGLLSRMRSWGKALWLYLQMYVRILGWSLLLVVPGVIAAFRYMLAPYYLAENPELSASECIEKSKQTMNGAKLSLFSLLLSFIGWQLLSSLLQIYLIDVSPVASIVAGLCISLFVATYTNAAVAAFYLTLTDERMRDLKTMPPDQLMRALSQINGLPNRFVSFGGATGRDEPEDPANNGTDENGKNDDPPLE